jgi:glutathione S-transferase
MRAKGIGYQKVIAAHGSPLPFLRKGSREELRAATGAEKLPALKLSDGTVLTHSKAILRWVAAQA